MARQPANNGKPVTTAAGLFRLILLTEHAESIVRSGWLQGPWKNGPLCVELIWLPRWDNRRLEIQQLKQFLGSQMEVHGDVDISVRDINTRPFSINVNVVVPLWDAWFNTEANFYRSEGRAGCLMPKDTPILLISKVDSYSSIF
jgi:hypothetical protein